MGLSPIKHMTPVRHTPSRMAVLRTVKFASEPMTAAEIVRVLKAQQMKRSTIFRNLSSLVQAGEIASIEGTDGVTRYIGHLYYEAIFRCQRCKKERRLKSQTLPSYVDRKMFGHQAIITSQLIAQGLCGACAKKTHV